MKHHYIPEYYLRGFCDDNGKLFSFNKTTGRVDLAGKSPGQVFYENDLHALVLDGDKEFFIEHALTALEDQCGQFLKVIEDVPDDVLVSVREVGEACNILMLCLYLQFWRLPSNAALALAVSDRLIDLYHERRSSELLEMLDVEIITELYESRHDENVKKIIQFLILPLISHDFDGTLPSDFALLRASNEFEFLSSDRPVLYEELTDDLSFTGNVYFPLSRRVMLLRQRSSEAATLDELQRRIVRGAVEKYFGSSIRLIEQHKATLEQRP